MRKPQIPLVDDKRVRGLLEKYKCPVPYHEVRTRFLGNIAAPAMAASPIQTVKGLWGGSLPEFETLEAVNDLIGTLINGLWNSLTRHQKRTEPFRLVRVPLEPTSSGLAAYALVRRQEIDGFVEGLFNGQNVIELPEKAQASANIIAELRAMHAGIYTLASDDTKPGSDKDLAATLKHVQELTPIIEREINEIVLACTRARRQMLQRPDFTGPRVH